MTRTPSPSRAQARCSQYGAPMRCFFSRGMMPTPERIPRSPFSAWNPSATSRPRRGPPRARHRRHRGRAEPRKGRKMIQQLHQDLWTSPLERSGRRSWFRLAVQQRRLRHSCRPSPRHGSPWASRARQPRLRGVRRNRGGWSPWLHLVVPLLMPSSSRIRPHAGSVAYLRKASSKSIGWSSPRQRIPPAVLRPPLSCAPWSREAR
mmetsp:Transcript_16906/g.59059  ORF Transcript_16906/g.59059 Transcript_16906/m.59059 type:complete len:205 (+) Transcript_16906:963-1577(+)